MTRYDGGMTSRVLVVACAIVVAIGTLGVCLVATGLPVIGSVVIGVGVLDALVLAASVVDSRSRPKE